MASARSENVSKCTPGFIRGPRLRETRREACEAQRPLLNREFSSFRIAKAKLAGVALRASLKGSPRAYDAFAATPQAFRTLFENSLMFRTELSAQHASPRLDAVPQFAILGRNLVRVLVRVPRWDGGVPFHRAERDSAYVAQCSRLAAAYSRKLFF